MDKRIVSLVPSWTHTLCESGLQDKIVGCTTFCVKPPSLYRSAVPVGGTKDPCLDKIRALNPTHIIVNEEENTAPHIEQLSGIAPILKTFSKKVDDVPQELRAIGQFLDCKEFDKLADSLHESLASIEKIENKPKKRVLYFIWKDPYMIAGRDTYIDSMLSLFGWENASKSEDRYPVYDFNEFDQDNVDLILLSSEPYPFRKRDRERILTELGSKKGASMEILKIDGQLGSWYGSLTAQALIEIKKSLESLPNSFVNKF